MCRPLRIPANAEERSAGRSVAATFVGWIVTGRILPWRLLYPFSMPLQLVLPY